MNRLLLLLVLILPLALYSQTFNYTFDPDIFEIVDESTMDTVIKMNDIDKLVSQKSFFIRSSKDVGSIRLRALDNPQIVIRDDDNTKAVEIYSALNGSGGAILLSDWVNGDTNTIRLVTNYASTNDARIITDELQINGGADLAEMFEINGPEESIKPGLLVAIDERDPGKLQLTCKPYDKKIAGVIAGANGVKPGILMGQEGTVADGDELVTLNGRTYLKANTLGGKIRPGDFLTSSSIPGEAMRVKNFRKARGAIIGKAMTSLIDGHDYVLVLVNLQ